MIEHFFEEKNLMGNVQFSKIESKWWNGHAYLPLYNFSYKEVYRSNIISVDAELRKSEFSKPSIIDGGAYGDRHLFYINCVIDSGKNEYNFSVKERSFFTRIFKSSSSENYGIRCEHIFFKDFLAKNKFLSEIYTIVENSPEFSPLIKGEYNNRTIKYELSIRYNTQKENVKVLNLFYLFCKDIIDFFENS